MANDVYATVRDFRSCSMNRINGKRQRQVRLFELYVPLDSVCMDIIEPLPKKKTGNKFVVVTTDRYTKLKRAISTSSITATTIGRSLLEHWVSNYGISPNVLAENGPQFFSKIFALRCSTL